MKALRSVVCLAVGAVALAGQQPQPPKPEAQEPELVIKVPVTEIVVPVTVLDRKDNFVNGLSPRQFRLFDNSREQDIKVQAVYQPISLVVVVQANSAVEAVLPQVKRIGSLLENFVVGEGGEAAVLAFDHRFQLLQPFSSDASKITEAVLKIKAGSSSARMIDAVQEATRMLKGRPPGRRRVILLISETRDVSSEARGREVLIETQLANVTIYTVNMNRMVTTVTKKPEAPRPDPQPPAARSMPSNVPATPTTVMQKSGGQGASADFVPLLVEVYRDVKSIFRDNPVEFFTKGTGGAEYSFVKQRGLEDAVARIGEEIHSQYLVNYTPNNQQEGGFHEIRVVIPDRTDVKIRTRPGYWLAFGN